MDFEEMERQRAKKQPVGITVGRHQDEPDTEDSRYTEQWQGICQPCLLRLAVAGDRNDPSTHGSTRHVPKPGTIQPPANCPDRTGCVSIKLMAMCAEPSTLFGGFGNVNRQPRNDASGMIAGLAAAMRSGQ